MPFLSERYPYELPEDVEVGFQEAVRNNQTNMALNYLVEILASMRSDIDDLKTTGARGKSKGKGPGKAKPKKGAEDE